MGGRGTTSPANKYAMQTGARSLIIATGYDDEDRLDLITARSTAVPGASTGKPIDRQQSEQVSAAQIQNEADLPYITITNQETPLGGAIYPFLEETGRAWAVVSHDLDNATSYP